MTYELRSIAPSRLARIMAWVLGVLFTVLMLFAIPIFLLTPAQQAPGQPPKSLFVVIGVLYPIIGALWGWICGHAVARAYNFVAIRIGGVTFEAVGVEGEAG